MFLIHLKSSSLVGRHNGNRWRTLLFAAFAINLRSNDPFASATVAEIANIAVEHFRLFQIRAYREGFRHECDLENQHCARKGATRETQREREREREKAKEEHASRSYVFAAPKFPYHESAATNAV